MIVFVDGYVVFDIELRYVKYKWMLIIELEYDVVNKLFNIFNGLLNGFMILIDLLELLYENIYECVIMDMIINVLKYCCD